MSQRVVGDFGVDNTHNYCDDVCVGLLRPGPRTDTKGVNDQFLPLSASNQGWISERYQRNIREISEKYAQQKYFEQ